MSFLRKMFSGKVTGDDPRRFLIEAMLGAMEADGDITDEEMEVLQKNLDEHEAFEGLVAEETSRLIDLAADAIRQADKADGRAAAIAKGLPNRSHRLSAYAMACEVCVSDNELPESEIKAFINRVAGPSEEVQQTEMLLEAGREALAQEDHAMAAQAFAQVLSLDNLNAAALAGLAKAQIGEGELDGLGHRMDEFGAVRIHAGEVEILQQRQLLQEDRPLRPGAAFQDRMPGEIVGERVFVMGLPFCHVVAGQHAAMASAA